jgi:glycosyltransferase involved in cell wall biosynthesis
MRVLHVIPAVAARYGGPSHAVVAMCRALSAVGVEPMIAATDADGLGRLDVPIGRPTSWSGVPAIFFRRDFSESFKYSRGLARWLHGHVRDFHAVHVHAVFSHAPLAAAAACRRSHTPYIVRPLGTIARWSLGRRSVRKRLLLTLAASRMLRDAAAIHYTSSGERHDAEAVLGLSGGLVIPLGTDATLLEEPGTHKTDPYVLVLSRLHPKKNLEPLIESFIDLTENGEHRGWRLIIAGEGDVEYVASLRRIANERSAGGRIAFAGWIDGTEKRDLMRDAALFALPSLQENFGISLVEAMALGVPALVSRRVDLAGEVEAAGAGWAVEGDRSSLRAGLAEALSSAVERESRGEAARKFARQFAWPAIARQLADVYSQVSTGSRGVQIVSPSSCVA